MWEEAAGICFTSGNQKSAVQVFSILMCQVNDLRLLLHRKKMQLLVDRNCMRLHDIWPLALAMFFFFLRHHLTIQNILCFALHDKSIYWRQFMTFNLFCHHPLVFVCLTLFNMINVLSLQSIQLWSENCKVSFTLLWQPHRRCPYGEWLQLWLIWEER